MRVKCMANDVDAVEQREVRERLRRYIKTIGPLSRLVVGDEYHVEAVETWSGHVWYYIHTGSDEYPTPYPADFFALRDGPIPNDWSIKVLPSLKADLIRLTFPEWTDDDNFYEKLVDGDPETVATYSRRRGGADRKAGAV